MAELPSPVCGSCPSPEQLAAFLREELPAADRPAIAAHVSNCPACESALRASDEPGDELLRQLGVDPIGPDESAAMSGDSYYQRMLAAALRALPTPDDEVAGEAPPPERIGQYRSLTRIGRGGMGVVYRAQHARLKKWVAVKVLPPDRVSDTRAVARFEREMGVVGRLDHPNIVRATDAGHADGFHYLAMDLIDGVDLARLVRRHGPLSVAEACELTRQAAVGLQHAHEHGLVHRDVKPNNLMVSARGEVKLLDLGLALLRGDQATGSLSASGAVMGTADYMAPEQWEASHDVDIRADIYSLGCTLFTLLAGSPPFSGPAFDTVYKKLKAHNEALVPPLPAREPAVPAALEQLVHRMLEKDRAARPQAPAEVARALGPFCSIGALDRLVTLIAAPQPGAPAGGTVETETLQELPTGRFSTTVSMPPTARRWRPVLAAVAGACAAVCALAFFARPTDRERQPAEDTHQLPPAPERPGPGEPARPIAAPPGVFAPGKWCELIDRPPTEMRWPRKPENSSYEYDPVRRSLNVTCQDWGMLALGEVNGSGFDLEATFIQTPWTGDVGVFVRGREDAPKGGARVVADTIVLERIPNHLTSSTAKLAHGAVQKFVAPPQQMFNIVSVPSGTVPLPTGETHRLSLSVGETGLESVKWDDRDVPEVCAAARSAKRTGANGAVGVWLRYGTVQFRSVRVRLRPPFGDPK